MSNVMIKQSVQPFPSRYCVMVYAYAQGRGPTGLHNGNKWIGWRVAFDGKDISEIFKNKRQAMQWAEERYRIVGWHTVGRSGGHHQHYGIPGKIVIEELDKDGPTT